MMEERYGEDHVWRITPLLKIMNLTQALMMGSNTGPFSVSLLAETSASNNYTGSATTSISNTSGSYFSFNNSLPNSMTQISSGGIQRVYYSIQHVSTVNYSYDYMLSATSTNTVWFNVTTVSGTRPTDFSWVLAIEGYGVVDFGTFSCPIDGLYSFDTSINHTPYPGVLVTLSCGPSFLSQFGGVANATASGTQTIYNNNYTFNKSKLFFQFDTSFLGTSANISSATLELNTSSITNNNSANVSIYRISSWPPTTSNDGSFIGTSTSLVTPKGLNTLTTFGYTTFNVTTSNINKTGFTNCRLEVDAPIEPSGATNTNQFYINMIDSLRPRLNLTYTT